MRGGGATDVQYARHEPVYWSVTTPLAGVSAVAVAGPTLRALRVHPVEALRQG